MAISAFTANAAAVLAKIKQLIDEKRIISWSYDTDGDFTHTPPQFKQKAWLRPIVKEDRLRWIIIVDEGKDLTRGIYAIYHGRFIEMLLDHVADDFTAVRATADSAKDEAPIV